MRTIEQAGVPYAMSIGNHDTRAVGWNGVPGSTGYGGSAYMYNPECLTRFPASECRPTKLVRHTEEFNGTFTAARYTSVGGAYEPGKVDNIFSTFSAGGHRWLVLTLELWARPGRRGVGAHGGREPPAAQRHHPDPRLPQRRRQHRR